MKKFILITLAVILTVLCLREIGVIRFESFSQTTASYSGSWPVDKKFAKPVTKIVVRDNSVRSGDRGNRESGTLYMYTRNFVFDQDFRRKIPIFKTGTERSYLSFEFVYDQHVFAGGAAGIMTEGKTVGFRSLRAMRSDEFKKLVEVVARYRGLEGIPIVYEL